MTPKGGPVNGIQARPITLLSGIYRIWAMSKVSQLKKWFTAAGIQPLVGGREEAEFQAGLLSLTIGYGKATGQGGGGIALDLSKAYDAVRLDLLEGVLLAAGLDTNLVGPALDMYRAPKAVRVQQALGETRVPDAGLPAVCPLATFFMAILMTPWRTRLRAVAQGARVRTWVDDLAAYAGNTDTAMQVITEGAEVAEALEKAGFLINRKKSGVVNAIASEGDALRACCPDLVATSGPVKDLGMVHGTGPQADALAATRWGPACDRLGRIGRLPQGTMTLGRLAAASAMGTGAFAAAGRAQPSDLLDAMRRQVRYACWRGGTRGDFSLLL